MKIKTIREDQNYIKISIIVKKLKHTLLFQYIDDLWMNQRSFNESWIEPDRSYSYDESGGRKRVEDGEF
mgnify:CR=1 FL=1